MAFNPLKTPLSKIIFDHTFDGIFHEDQFDTFEVSQAEIDDAIKDIKGRLGVKLQSGKVSNVLLLQLARHKLNHYEKFGNQIHCYHFQTILDIIESVEKGWQANIRPFNGNLLGGLKHVHHNSSTFISQNLGNHWRSKVAGRDEIKYQNELLEQIFNKISDELSQEIANKRALTILLTQLLTESKFRKQKKQTGEWIVFAEKDGINYYLCLATHHEAIDFTDRVIYDRLISCVNEFPELNDVISKVP
ncbi:MAG: hypothetical protein WDO14_05115 [Bacteroidota bacterium]